MADKESIIIRAARMASDKAEADAATEAEEQREELVSELPPSNGALVPKKTSSRDIMRMRDTSLYTHEELAAKRIIHDNMEDSAVQAAFMNLRTNILRRCQDKGSVILVSSIAYDGGASFVAMNLATALAADQTKTSLIVNCNMAKAGVVDDLIDPNSKGVSDYIADPEIGAHEVIHPSGVRRVRVVPPGSQRNSFREFFSDKRWRKLIR